MTGYGTHALVDMVVLGHRLDSLIPEIFSNPNYSVIQGDEADPASASGPTVRSIVLRWAELLPPPHRHRDPDWNENRTAMGIWIKIRIESWLEVGLAIGIGMGNTRPRRRASLSPSGAGAGPMTSPPRAARRGTRGGG